MRSSMRSQCLVCVRFECQLQISAKANIDIQYALKSAARQSATLFQRSTRSHTQSKYVFNYLLARTRANSNCARATRTLSPSLLFCPIRFDSVLFASVRPTNKCATSVQQLSGAICAPRAHYNYYLAADRSLARSDAPNLHSAAADLSPAGSRPPRSDRADVIQSHRSRSRSRVRLCRLHARKKRRRSAPN